MTIPSREGLAIKRNCYFPNKRPRVWWWKIVDADGKIVEDGFSSRREAVAALSTKGDAP